MFRPPQLPSPLADVLGAVRALPTGDAVGWTPAERAAWLVGMRQLVDAAEAGFTEVLAAFDARGDGETLHAARSTASWLRGAAHLAPGDATERVRIARGLRDGALEAPVAGMADGTVTYDQARAIARAVRPLPDAEVLPAVQTLTALAVQADAGRVRFAGRHLRAVADPDGSRIQFEADYERRFLMLSPLLDGMVGIDGVLDAEGAAMLSAALVPFGVPASPDDDRSAAQRRADGLVDLARLAMEHDALGVSGGRRPQLDVLCSLEALLADSAVPALLPHAPGGPAVLPPVSLQRLCCDATVSRVLLDPASVAVDLGRSVRVFPTPLRRAISLRDGGCRFPGCGLPPAWTDAHHIRPWSQGGETSRANGILLCRFHHRKTHEGGWRIAARDPVLGGDGVLDFHSPDGRRLECRPPPLAA